MTSKKMIKKINKNLGKIIMYSVLILMCLAVLFPFAIVISTSLKTYADSVTVKESVELLTDDIINYLFNDVEVYEYLSEGTNKITFSYEEAKKIKAIMVYDSADYLYAGKEASVKVGGHSFELKFNPDYCYVDEYGFEMKIPGSAAILEFEELEAKEVTLTFKGDISINEIVILGK